MYSVNCKFNGSNMTIYTGSYQNCYEVAIDEIYNLIGFYDGFQNIESSIVKEFPQSTHPQNQTKALYFCLVADNHHDIFKIYKHYKEMGYIFSTHVYEKLATVRIIFNGAMVQTEREKTGFVYKDVWDYVIYELKEKTEPLLN